MYKFFLKYGQTLAIILGVLVVALFFIPVFQGLDAFNAIDPKNKVARAGTTIFDLGLKITIFLAIATAVIALLFAIYHLFTNLKGSMKGIIGLAVIAVLFFILYSMAKPEVNETVLAAMNKFNVSQGTGKFISAALQGTVGLAIFAFAALVLFEIRNLLK